MLLALACHGVFDTVGLIRCGRRPNLRTKPDCTAIRSDQYYAWFWRHVGREYGSAGRLHVIVWGLILTAVILALLLAGGLNAIQAAMIVGAIPFSLMMIFMAIALLKALYRDGLREDEGNVELVPATDAT